MRHRLPAQPRWTGNVVTSTDPTGGAASWKLTNVDGSNDLSGISCPTVSLCVAVDVWGKAVIGVKHRAHDHRDHPGD